MAPRVAPYLMAFGMHPAYNISVRCTFVVKFGLSPVNTGQEECGRDVALFQNVQEMRSVYVGSIVKGYCDCSWDSTVVDSGSPIKNISKVWPRRFQRAFAVWGFVCIAGGSILELTLGSVTIVTSLSTVTLEV